MVTHGKWILRFRFGSGSRGVILCAMKINSGGKMNE